MERGESFAEVTTPDGRVLEATDAGEALAADAPDIVAVHPPDQPEARVTLSGPVLRGSGVDWDLRRDGKSVLPYDELDWKVWTHPDGDSFARYWVRLQEVRESISIVGKLLDSIPSGPIMAKVPKIMKPPPGEIYHSIEAPKGELGYLIVSDGSTAAATAHTRGWKNFITHAS